MIDSEGTYRIDDDDEDILADRNDDVTLSEEISNIVVQ